MQHSQINSLKMKIAAKGNDLAANYNLKCNDIVGISNPVISKIQNYHLDKVGLGQIIVYYETVSKIVGQPATIQLSFMENAVA